jgi:integrase
MKQDILTARRVAAIIRGKKWGRHHDGHGLYLVGSPRYETFHWELRLYRGTATGKPRDLGMGSARLFTLKEVRERACKLRKLAFDGIDPLEQRRKDQDDARSAAAERVTFKDAVKEFLSTHSPTWKNARHRAQWATTLTNYVLPSLGERPVGTIDAAVINETMAPVWTRTPETARRTCQRIERVVKWVRDGKPLPHPGASKLVKHHKAKPFEEMPTFMAELRNRTAMSARALEFTVLTAARTSEAVHAKWEEIDLKEKTWVVPAERMKKGREHIVPLSKRVVDILSALPRTNEFVFPGIRPGKPISNVAMLELLRSMRDGDTVHGFRSSFRDWAGDRTSYPHEVIEFALAHSIPSKVQAAYRRYSALQKRRALMEAWAQFCASTAISATVTTLRRRSSG